MIKNASKQLQSVVEPGSFHHDGNDYSGTILSRDGIRYIVSFLANGRDEPENSAVCFHAMRDTARHDLQSDYHAGAYFRNLTQAIRFARR